MFAQIIAEEKDWFLTLSKTHDCCYCSDIIVEINTLCFLTCQMFSLCNWLFLFLIQNEVIVCLQFFWVSGPVFHQYYNEWCKKNVAFSGLIQFMPPTTTTPPHSPNRWRDMLTQWQNVKGRPQHGQRSKQSKLNGCSCKDALEG